MAPRFRRRVDLEVGNAEGRWRAKTVDVSMTGALLRIEDEAFAGPEVVHNFVRYGAHVTRAFGGGMELYLPDLDDPLPASFVRVKRDAAGPGEGMLIACRFTVAPEGVQQRALGLDRTEPAGEPEPEPEAERAPEAEAEPAAAEEPDPVDGSGDGAVDEPIDFDFGTAELPGEPPLRDPFRAAESVPAARQLPLDALHEPAGDPLPAESLPSRAEVGDPLGIEFPGEDPAPRPVGEDEWPDERRDALRADQLRYLEACGRTGCYKARALNVSAVGVLISLTDRQFAPPTEQDQLLHFTQRLGEEFGDGMEIRFPDSDVRVPAEVVRLTERLEGGLVQVVIGCRFQRALSQAECESLKLEPTRPVTSPVVPGPGETGSGTHLRELLRYALEAGATDLHLKVGAPPRLRVMGALIAVGTEPLRERQAEAMARELLDDAQVVRFEERGNVELMREFPGVGRFRIGALRQRGATSLAIRCMPSEVPTVESLGLPDAVRRLAECRSGLVLVTGPTGAGKSTTLAALLDHVNRTRACHLLTIESPVEYVHVDREAHVTQREVGLDAVAYREALEGALRQDPDVILVDEMHDLDTLALALTAAETGRLVFGSLPTPSAARVPDRIIDVFPWGHQNKIRRQLAACLQGIVTQTLVPCEREGVTLAQEILVFDDDLRSHLLQGRGEFIDERLNSGEGGAVSLESSLNRLVERGEISWRAAMVRANVPTRIYRQ